MKKQRTTEVEAKCLALSVCQLLRDYKELAFWYSEGPEKFFEEWMAANFHTAPNERFERLLLQLFISKLWKRIR